MNLFGGYKKNSAVWQGEHKEEVRKFINPWLPKADLSEFYLKGYGIKTRKGTFSHFQHPYGKYEKAETFATEDESADVYVEGIDI